MKKIIHLTENGGRSLFRSIKIAKTYRKTSLCFHECLTMIFQITSEEVADHFCSF
jgi:hypothetical protein